MKTPTSAKRRERHGLEPVNRVMGIHEWGLIIILSVMWGGSFFFVGVAVKEMTPLTIVWSRVGIASIILLAVVHLKGDRMPSSPGTQPCCLWLDWRPSTDG